MECAILPPSLAFAQAVPPPECPSSLLCPVGSRSVPPPTGSPPGFLRGPWLGEDTPLGFSSVAPAHPVLISLGQAGRGLGLGSGAELLARASTFTQ